MLYIFEFLIFLIVCFLYIHIYYHLKVSNSLEVYEIDDCTKDRFEEICNLRQPFVGKSSIIEISNMMNSKQLNNIYSAFDVKIRNNKNFNSKTEDLYYPLKWRDAVSLMSKDDKGKYICENNYDFIEETELLKEFQRNDSFLRPPMVSNCKYDIMKGSINSYTPFRYELSFRTFFYILEGNVTIKLCPPKNNKYLFAYHDYELFEFRSQIDPWDVKSEFVDNFDKIKMLEIHLTKGEYVFIPAYWWYTIKYNSDDNLLGKFQYYTYMNNLSLLPKFTMYILQNQNIRHRYFGTRVESPDSLPNQYINEQINEDLNKPNDDDEDDNEEGTNNKQTNNNQENLSILNNSNLILTEKNLATNDNNIQSFDQESSNLMEL